MSVSSDQTSTQGMSSDERIEEIHQLVPRWKAAMMEECRQEQEKSKNDMATFEERIRQEVENVKTKIKNNKARSNLISHLNDLSFEELVALEETRKRRDTDCNSSEVTNRSDRTLEPGDQRSEACRTAGGPIFYSELLRGSVSKHAGSSGVSSRESSEAAYEETSGALFEAFSGASSGENPGAFPGESSGLSDKKMSSQIRKMSASSDKTSDETKDMASQEIPEDEKMNRIRAERRERIRQELYKIRNGRVVNRRDYDILDFLELRDLMDKMVKAREEETSEAAGGPVYDPETKDSLSEEN
ncbi:unnamed protein product [Caenorhabditis nigoni]